MASQAYDEQTGNDVEQENERMQNESDKNWSNNSAEQRVEPQIRGGKRSGGSLDQSFSEIPAIPLNVGTMSVTSWDAASEPTIGTDAGTDQDVAAASGIPEGDSDDEDEEDDMFEVADSLDLGAVALCVSVRPIVCFCLYQWT